MLYLLLRSYPLAIATRKRYQYQRNIAIHQHQSGAAIHTPLTRKSAIKITRDGSVKDNSHTTGSIVTCPQALETKPLHCISHFIMPPANQTSHITIQGMLHSEDSTTSITNS